MKTLSILTLSICLTIALTKGEEHIPQPPGKYIKLDLRGEEESIPPAKNRHDDEIDEVARTLEELGIELVQNDKRASAPPIPSPDQQAKFYKRKRELREKKRKEKAEKMRNKFKVKSRAVEQQIREKLAQKREVTPPQSYAINMLNSQFASSHPNGHLRPGFPTGEVLCDTVFAVTADMRDSDNMYMAVHPHYTKYTSVYGIYIVGSDDVSDASLKRACYVIKTMFASRFDILVAIYLLYIRFALIGDHEVLTSLPEYYDQPHSLNDRARGLGSTLFIPMVSAGSDNMACKPFDVYWDQDVMVHEAAHAVQQQGAAYVIPNFELLLEELFERNVLIGGKWQNTYAATNPAEYFAVATQHYFNSYKGSEYFPINVHGRESMRNYDPEITNLLDEVYSCAAADEHMFIDRCHWKNCSTGANFALRYSEAVQAKSLCPELESFSYTYSADECAQKTCEVNGNAFNWKGSKCKALNCTEPVFDNMQLVQGQGSFNIYYGFAIPQMTVEEIHQDQPNKCFNGPDGTPMCQNLAVKQSYGGLGKKKCRQRGGCWDTVDTQCYFADDKMADKNVFCIEKAKSGDCDKNPNFLYYFCPVACGVADKMDQLPPESELRTRCGDWEFHCDYWVDAGECTNNPGFMNDKCPMSCVTQCTPTNPLNG